MLDLLHLQYFFGALVSLVVITNPPSKIPLFVSLTVGMTREQRHQQANWAAIYSFLVMIVSLIAGNMLLAFFGISYSAMRIAGGLVIAMIGYQMLFGGNSPNNAPMVRRNKEDYELTDRTQMITAFLMTGLAIAATSLIAWITLRSSEYCSDHLGPSGMAVLGKLMGFILICIGVQFVGSGIKSFIAS